MKEPNSDDWVDALYFAEVLQMFGQKYYSCFRLDPKENGIDPCIIEISVDMLQYSYHLSCYSYQVIVTLARAKVWKTCSTLSQVDLKVACPMFTLVCGTNE